ARATTATSTTLGQLDVKVPVLSNATIDTRPKASNAAPPLTRTPCLEAAPTAATTVTGTEIANAHGEAATSTTKARSTHVAGSPRSEPTPAISAATTITPGTSGRATRSANRCPAPLRACSASTTDTMRANELSDAAAVTATSNTPVPLMAPANTSSPGPASTGTDSPVMADTSKALRPVTTVPSVATRSPGLTTITSPTRNCSGATVHSTPPRTT